MQVTRVVGAQLLDLLEVSSAGGLLGEGHSWVGPTQASTSSTHSQVACRTSLHTIAETPGVFMRMPTMCQGQCCDYPLDNGSLYRCRL